MKRIFIPTLFLCLLSLPDAKGQDTLVDKQPQNRAALLEEFTGVNCGYCPAGHVLTNQLLEEHGGRLFVFNLHAPNSDLVIPPNGTADMRTEYGDALASNAGVNTLPLGTVNRHSFNGSLSLGREQWASAIGQVLEMPAYLNVGARATLDWESRELSVEVQLYYTGEASVEENHIHVALVQNNIQGYQKNGYQNPEQSLGGSLYLHQHIFRDFLTGQWGDAVPAGEAGTFLSRTYSKTLPGQIRNVDLDLTELQVIVFVSEDRNEIINACEALIQHENGPGHVFGLSKGTQPQDVFTCDNSVRVAFEFENRNPEGTASAVESVEFLYKSRNREHTFTWQPDSAFGFRQTAKVVSDEFPLYLNGVPDTVEVTVAEAVDYMTGVDAAHLQVNGLAPRALYVGGPSHIVGAMGRVIDIELAIVLYEVGGITRAGHTADRLPRQKVARMPDEESRGITERRMGHVIIRSIANNRRVGKVARQNNTRKA